MFPSRRDLVLQERMKAKEESLSEQAPGDMTFTRTNEGTSFRPFASLPINDKLPWELQSRRMPLYRQRSILRWVYEHYFPAL